MDVQLTSDQLAFVRDAIESGRLRSESDAVKEALSLWEQRERARAELVAAVEAAEISLARGMGRPVTAENMQQLADAVKRRGRERVLADHTTQP